MNQNYSINCDEGVRVSFVLAGNNVENMDVHMYNTIGSGDEKETSLLASLHIRDGKITCDTFPKTASPLEVERHSIGLACIELVQEKPKILIGNI